MPSQVRGPLRETKKILPTVKRCIFHTWKVMYRIDKNTVREKCTDCPMLRTMVKPQ